MSKSVKSHHPNQRLGERPTLMLWSLRSRGQMSGHCASAMGRHSCPAASRSRRLPAMYGFREFANAGGLMSYGYGLPDAYRQSARPVVRILKDDRPADLPLSGTVRIGKARSRSR
jgi:hypothetical protein